MRKLEDKGEKRESDLHGRHSKDAGNTKKERTLRGRKKDRGVCTPHCNGGGAAPGRTRSAAEKREKRKLVTFMNR